MQIGVTKVLVMGGVGSGLEMGTTDAKLLASAPAPTDLGHGRSCQRGSMGTCGPRVKDKSVTPFVHPPFGLICTDWGLGTPAHSEPRKVKRPLISLCKGPTKNGYSRRVPSSSLSGPSPFMELQGLAG